MSLLNPLSPTAPWDFASSSYAGLSDSDFLAMLEKQVASSNSSTTGGPTAGASFTLTPPLSEEDSSPSPSNTELDHRASSSGTPEDDSRNSKRKLSIDDDDDLDDEAPLPKHRGSGGSDENKKGHARRKSNPHKDESRLMKRKEQNRAAQRAFRERKEKHVKDLEERVAMLEQEKSDQAHENENLRDLLTRLQSENQMLKQGQFTFSMPSAAKPRSQTASDNSSPASSSSNPGEATVPVFAQTSPPVVDTSGFNSTLFSLPNASTSTADSTPSSDSLTGMFGSFPQTTSWTTLATAPQYTSYRDPIYDRLFGGAGDISPYATRGDDEEGGGPTLEELFGEEFGDLIPIVGDFSPAAEAVLGGMDASFTSTEDDAAAAAPSAAMQLDEPHHPQRPEDVEGYTPCPSSKEGVERLIASGGGEQTFGPPLPTPPTPGPLPTISPLSGLSAFTSSSSASGSLFSSAQGSPADQENDDECPFASGLGGEAPLQKLSAQDGPHVSVGEAWKRVRTNPHFEECDIDDLCAALKEKARCDAGKPVIEERTVAEVIRRMDQGGRMA